MKNQPKISVILISYNHAQYLHETIDSVLKQTFSDFELIIWDDASTDESWDIINSYEDTRIRAFRNRTNTVSGNVNKAIVEEASGEYIAIHHSDDVWLPQKLENQVEFLDSNPQVGAVFCKAHIIDENGKQLADKTHFYNTIFDQPNRTRYEWLNFFFYHGNVLCHPSVLLRRVCYDDCGLYRDGLNQLDDLDMWVRLCLKYDIHILPEKLVRFRVRASDKNVSGNRLEVHIRGQFEIFQICNNYRGIESPEDFIKVFPKSKIYFKPEGFDLGFALGMMALETETFNPTKLFGLSLLFEALNNPIRAQKVGELYGLRHKEFVALTAEHDVFSIGIIAQMGGLSAQVQALSAQVQALSAQAQALSAQAQALSAQVQLLESRRIELEATLQNIYNSKTWRLTQSLQRLRLKLAPPGTFRERVFRLIIGS
jgi:glycosyltransferase involved in cell wall biosynthesis